MVAIHPVVMAVTLTLWLHFSASISALTWLKASQALSKYFLLVFRLLSTSSTSIFKLRKSPSGVPLKLVRFASRTCRIVNNCQHLQVIPYQKRNWNDLRIMSKLTDMLAKIYARTRNHTLYPWASAVRVRILCVQNHIIESHPTPSTSVHIIINFKQRYSLFFSSWLNWTELVSCHNTSGIIMVLLLDKIGRMQLYSWCNYPPYYCCQQGKAN